MKRTICAAIAAASLVTASATLSYAKGGENAGEGGVSVQTVETDTAASSSRGIIIPLLLLALVAAAVDAN